MRRLACLSAIALALVPACESPVGGRRARGESVPVDVSATLSEITAGWAREGDYLVSPANEEEGAATRVGALVRLANDGDMPWLEARAVEAGEPAGEWIPMATTWSEGDHYVAIADLGRTATGAQLRIAVDAVDRLSSVLWDATIPEEPDADDGDGTGVATEPLVAGLTGLGIVTRAEWGAAATRCTTRDPRRTRMAVHYTVTPSVDPARQVRSIQRYHMDTRGWCDVGYHFLVGIDGRIFEGRPIELLGAHASGSNSGNVGVSFVGCFHSTGCASMGPTTPSDAMLDAGGRLLGTLSRLYSIPLERSTVKGHREHAGASTDCPGDHLFARIDRLLAIGRTSTLGDPPAPPPAPTPPPPPPAPASCGGLPCGACEATSGCGYCASQAGCVATGRACAFAGDVGSSACWDALWPCATATCWNPTAPFVSCGRWSIDENFSSGRFSVHRYWAHLFPGGVTTISLARTSGTMAPAILVSDRAGRLAYGGDVAAVHGAVTVLSATTGRIGGAAEVRLTARADLDVYVYVTDWAVLDAAFGGRVSTTARYRLVASHDCAAATAPPASSDPYAGLTQSGSEIPRAGLANPTLRSALGVSAEPYGTVVDYAGRSWVSGRVSWFGGPSDGGVSATETGAITGEHLRSLGSPEHPDAATLASRPADYYYLAMRFSYSPNGTSWWRDARLVVTNPTTGASVVVRPVDWGPNTSTGRVLDLSPQTLADLGLDTDDTALVAFAAPGAPLGVVR
jgi:hypothetical protein